MTGAGKRETAARQEAGSAELEEVTCRLSQRRQRKRRGRVTEAAAHMPEILSTNRASCPQIKAIQRPQNARDLGGFDVTQPVNAASAGTWGTVSSTRPPLVATEDWYNTQVRILKRDALTRVA